MASPFRPTLFTAAGWVFLAGVFRTSLEFQFTGTEGTLAGWASLIGLQYAQYLAASVVLAVATRSSARDGAVRALWTVPLVAITPLLNLALVGSASVFPGGLLPYPVPAGTLFAAVLLGVAVVVLAARTGARSLALGNTFPAALAASYLLVLPIPEAVLEAVAGGSLRLESLLMWNFLWYFLLCSALLLVGAALTSRAGLVLFLRNLRLARTGHFLLMMSLGLVAARRFAFPLLSEPPAATTALYLEDLPYLLTCLLFAFLGWTITTMTNDIFDVDIDRLSDPRRPLVAGVISRRQYVSVALLTTLLGIGMSPLIGSAPFFLLMFLGFLAWAYSAPPLRLRNYAWSTAIIGVGSATVFVVGYYATGYATVTTLVPRLLQLPLTPSLDLDPTAALVAVVILTALSISPMITQLKDYEGDRKAGARTIYTILGRERGKRVVTAVIPVLFLAPVAVIHAPPDVLVALAAGVAAAAAFLRRESHQVVFATYLVTLLYFLLRWGGTLRW